MSDPLEDALTAAEDTVTAAVSNALDEVAAEYAAALTAATELVAARVSVSRIARIWSARVPAIVRRLLSVAETAAARTAVDVDTPLPDGWDDLPSRHQDGRALPPSLGDYVRTTEHLLRAVGDRLSKTAVRELAEGLNAGEDIEQLRTRLRAAFAREGAQLGDAREERIARTEAARAWNTATLAAARDLTTSERPLVKQWLTRRDTRVRDAHASADGQLRLLDEAFTIAGISMTAPGDPSAPPALTVNCRCVLKMARAERTAAIPLGPLEEAHMDTDTALTAALPSRRWSTPGDTGIAFENQQTGDGRVFAPGALFWDAGPWPLQYADEMLMGHEGAELAGAIETMGREADRITASGVLYSTRPAGADAAMLLEEGAPLGVSVDLDDVDVEFVDRTTPEDGEEELTEHLVLAASLAFVSVLRLDDGSLILTASTAPEWTASGMAMSRSRHAVQLITGPNGAVSASAVRKAFAGTSALTAAAGDTDDPDKGVVVHSEHSGDLLVRVTRARVRGATLVAMPAYARSRIVLDGHDDEDEEGEEMVSAAAPGTDHHRVIAYVSASPLPVGAREVAQALDMSMESARGHLARATTAGRIVRLARGQYVGSSSLPEGAEVTASLSGDTDLPVHEDREAVWDGDAAASRVLAWATDEGGTVDADRLSRAFLYRDPDADPATLSAYKLGYADVINDQLRIIARGVFAVAAALQGARGGVDVPEDERGPLRERVEDLYIRLGDAFTDPDLHAPWEDDPNGVGDLVASAWTAMQEMPSMPATWFREPTPEELPPGSGGVRYAAGRIYGWVAQVGEPHAGYPGENLTIESLGAIDTTHFLRTRFALDDGTYVKAGALTMNVGHHRDGAECETASCQFDDTRTVAGIVTVGRNSRGLWFSGAAGPWLSEWDRKVFAACQPSYHMQQSPTGRWQLRAVLSVPVPGHSSPLLATAMAERSNLALAASAAGGLFTSTNAMPGQRPDTSGQPVSGQSPNTSGHVAPSPAGGVPSLTAALTDPAVLDTLLTALERREAQRTEAARAELDRLTAAVAPARDLITTSTNTRDGVA